MTFLSKVERAYLQGTTEFTKAQQRYIRYRLNKKLKLLDEELQIFGILQQKSRDAAAVFRDAASVRPRGLSTAFIKKSPNLPINAPKLELGSISLGKFSF